MSIDNDVPPATEAPARTLRIAVVVGGDQLARPDTWTAALNALPGVVVHLCDDLAEHEDALDLDFVLVTGTGPEAAGVIWAALGRQFSVAYDQVFSSSDEELEDFYAFAEAQGRHLAHLDPYARPAEQVVELLADDAVGELRAAYVYVALPEPATPRERLAVDGLGAVLPLFGGRQPVRVDDHPIPADFSADVRFEDRAVLTVVVWPDGGGARPGRWLLLEFASGTVVTLLLPVGDDAPITGQRHERGGRITDLPPIRSPHAAECFQETARTFLDAIHSGESMDTLAATRAALTRHRIAVGLSDLVADGGHVDLRG